MCWDVTAFPLLHPRTASGKLHETKKAKTSERMFKNLVERMQALPLLPTPTESADASPAVPFTSHRSNSPKARRHLMV
jgi:hypothetical protein